MKTAIMLLALAMSGCATKLPAVTETVKVPVIVPCVKDVPARPDYEFEKLELSASDGEKVLALARDYPRGRKYEGGLLAVIAGCSPIGVQTSATARGDDGLPHP